VSPSPTSHWLSEPATSSAQVVCPTANATEPPEAKGGGTTPSFGEPRRLPAISPFVGAVARGGGRQLVLQSLT
jgi:hypothetical protein